MGVSYTSHYDLNFTMKNGLLKQDNVVEKDNEYRDTKANCYGNGGAKHLEY